MRENGEDYRYSKAQENEISWALANEKKMSAAEPNESYT